MLQRQINYNFDEKRRHCLAQENKRIKANQSQSKPIKAAAELT